MTDSLGIHRISDIIFLSRQPFYALCGLTASFENRSGTNYRVKTRVSHLANKRIKANLSNAARSAIQNDPELRLHYDRKAKEGKEWGNMDAVKFKKK